MKDCVKKWLAEQIGVDDEAVLGPIYEEYRETAKKLATKAKQELIAGEFETLDRTAHTLKGSIASVGDNDMLEVVLELRAAAKERNVAVAASKIAKIFELIESL